MEALLIEKDNKAELGRNRIPRPVIDPEEFTDSETSPKDPQKSNTKRTEDGFKIIPNTGGSLQPTSATQSAKVQTYLRASINRGKDNMFYKAKCIHMR